MSVVSWRSNLLVRVLIVGSLLLVFGIAVQRSRSLSQAPRREDAQQAGTTATIYLPIARQSLSPTNVPLADTNYPFPEGALFVAADGSDDNPGTEQAPLATIRKAVSKARSGATIVLRHGVYRESVVIYGKALTIQPYPHERAWLDGAIEVTGWVADGGSWRKDGWSYQFPQGGLAPEFIDPAYPLAAHPDMVFANGTPLAQVASRAAVVPGTFFVDYARQQLFIGDNPAGKQIEASVLAQALDLNQAHGSVVRGLGFMRYATHRDQFGAVKGNAARLMLENNTFAWNAASGLSMLGPDGIVRANRFLYNGQLGMHAFKADRLVFEQNIVAYNNQERFAYWEAGGVKAVTVAGTLWRDNQVFENRGNGLWLDISCYDATVVRNRVRGNHSQGIMVEISAKALIASNVVVKNREYGVYISESADVDVINNTLANNRQNIRIYEGTRTNPADPLNTWDVRDITVENNILSNTTDPEGALLSVYDQQRQRTGEQLGVSADFNAYYRTNSGMPATVVRWPGVADPDMLFASLDEFRHSTGQEFNGIAIDDQPINPFFADEVHEDYRLRADSPAVGIGRALNPDVAAMIGAPAGVPMNLGALDMVSQP
jgi:poly(beta-D-mannuronate) C5 epimerase